MPLLATVAAIGCGGRIVADEPRDASPALRDAPADDPDAADASEEPDGPACRVVVASDYDQSCTEDTDCFAVAQARHCPAVCPFCDTDVVGRAAKSQYDLDFAAATGDLPDAANDCECVSLHGSRPCCRGGGCTFDCTTPADTLAGCADAGGTCSLQAPTALTCLRPGPTGTCAYADQICCLK